MSPDKPEDRIVGGLRKGRTFQIGEPYQSRWAFSLVFQPCRDRAEVRTATAYGRQGGGKLTAVNAVDSLNTAVME